MRFTQSLSKILTLSLCGCLVFLIGCSDDNSDAPEEEMQQELPVDNTARLSAKTLYEDLYLASQTTPTDTAWNGDEPGCDPGEVPQATKDKIFMRLSYFRNAAGLNNTISENATKSMKAQHAALMMDANNQLEHNPPNSWKCYTSDGDEGAGNSLLTLTRNAEAITSYVRDQGANNGPVGHRRWLLWPRLAEIGIGNTDQANAIWVLGNAGTPPGDAPEFIAWPPEGYVPDAVVYPRWSFSIAGADFSTASVSVRDLNGNNISLQVEALSTVYGDPTIVWVPDGIDLNSEEDRAYTVSISGVTLNDELVDYEYQVILFDPLR
ncbi:CAP domain-containing protein [Poritiphilus flavus]|uniref:SCP domain-containing protein n=1 Tax=Poritiphilus flavus TaxID=2697053 RepID=A0A6L9E832_9FLAO|nr:CAP domain-containing protein [Poritiphilus flavus]NAS10804.1 hypothetical protein [Poritiphilus flavus]